jgi:hypothetical protein
MRAKPRPPSADPVKTFGPVRVVDGVTFELAPGRI